ncbi:MAG: nucleotide pyrophosphohydrolase [Euryarchaeota archaeon]|jgi:NTP pyrophosphatase (non-canonical NTP hydrolase)|nr:nucleotide pyrophosphohydrolase [Euryarchaeota archaeon]
MEIVETSKKIDKWMDARGITDNGTALGQAIKTLEETTELLDAINHNNTAEIKDAIGDIYVTIRGVCRVLDLSMDECVFMAYNQIKDRTGHLTSEGVFVKDE